MKSIVISSSTGKTLSEIFNGMSDCTTCYITYATCLAPEQSDAIRSMGFSQYTALILTKLNEWSEQVIMISTNGNKLGFWNGNKNTDILSTMRVV